MHATLLSNMLVSSNTFHNAFTSVTNWQGQNFVAYRQALSHGIIPKGVVYVLAYDIEDDDSYEKTNIGIFEHPEGDVRDPRLIATDEALYCVVGVYLPSPSQGTPYKLVADSQDNLIQTMVTWTTDGATWAPLTPILRPGYWGWSAIHDDYRWYMASYHTHLRGQSQSIHLDTSLSLFSGWGPWTCIYDGASFAHENGIMCYKSALPSEPVLYWVEPGTMACCLRTGTTMEIGVSRYPYQEWRWWDTRKELHPSAVMHTPHGLLMAAREIQKATPRSLDKERVRPTIYRTSLYHVYAQHVTKILELPSGGDTGYAGITETDTPDEYHVSYYSQHRLLRREYFDVTMPSAEVYVARVKIEA